jgi:hypothetical protein
LKTWKAEQRREAKPKQPYSKEAAESEGSVDNELERRDLSGLGLPRALENWLLSECAGPVAGTMLTRQEAQELAMNVADEYKALEKAVSKALGKLKHLGKIDPPIKLTFMVGRELGLWEHMRRKYENPGKRRDSRAR